MLKLVLHERKINLYIYIFFTFSHCLFHYRSTLLPRPPPHPIQLTSRKRLDSKQYRHHLMVLGLSKGMFVDGNIQSFALEALIVGVLFCSFGATLSNWGQYYMINLSFIGWLHFALYFLQNFLQTHLAFLYSKS